MENKNRKQGRKKKSWENERKEIKREGEKKGGRDRKPTFIKPLNLIGTILNAPHTVIASCNPHHGQIRLELLFSRL